MRYFVLPLALVGLGITVAEDWPARIPVGAPIYAVPSDDAVRDYWIKVYSERFDVDVRWVSAVSHAENKSGDPGAVSRTGCCTGSMQVNHRVWFGAFDEECGGSDLLDARVGICYGVLIWKWHMERCQQVVSCALRAYVGQVANVREGNRYVAEVLSNWLEGV